MQHVIFASYGNDSVALIQWAYEQGLKDVHVAYSDTGWAAGFWESRVQIAEQWVRELGFTPHRISSEGMEALVKRKKAWPRGGGKRFQFCTGALKVEPAFRWLAEHDPDCEAICLVGIRREESSERTDAPEWIEESPNHGGRSLYAPLVRHTERMRNALIDKTPLPVLPYRSKECSPCVNARQQEIKHLEERRIAEIERIETDAGTNSKGNPRVMYSPARHGGAVGIRAVVEHAKGSSDDLFPVSVCSSGWCGR
ncbi:phosphoadenosine phosphosulfate reductase family protein [Thalassospira lohafexi]|uniref:Phosphoadenosine phosphosulfate reductase n=1 Tax=Thalassospira lohafexi TaxID=744227 RepID=A0A2N3L0K5_9PROT|nr:phosphoadenosine phosphosulfate reductase family protein [Thalassospira lohafexi]PKR56359.1 phosphoadenosine phosphosulfate reductase [Thalassospira lohafexi]